MGKRGVYFILLMTFLLASFGCGGGGGGDDDGFGTGSCDLPGFGAKIIFGTECNASRSAVVHIDIARPGGVATTCSGTLISSLHVLTAGQCVPDLPTGVVVTVNGATIPAQQIFIDPNYRIGEEFVFNDAAIILLARPASGPIAPLLESVTVAAGDPVSVYGFGLNENGIAGVLRSGEMRLTAVIGNLLQAQFTADGVNTCLGDAGGPMVAEKNGPNGRTLVGVVGITSTGTDPACQLGDVSTFTNLQFESVLSFVKSVVPGVQTI